MNSGWKLVPVSNCPEKERDLVVVILDSLLEEPMLTSCVWVTAV